MDKQVPVSAEIVDRMNGIYEKLWNEYERCNCKRQNGVKGTGLVEGVDIKAFGDSNIIF